MNFLLNQTKKKPKYMKIIYPEYKYIKYFCKLLNKRKGNAILYVK